MARYAEGDGLYLHKYRHTEFDGRKSIFYYNTYKRFPAFQFICIQPVIFVNELMWASLKPVVLENYFRGCVTPCSVIGNVRTSPKLRYINCKFCVVIPQMVLLRAIATGTSNLSLFYAQRVFVSKITAQ